MLPIKNIWGSDWNATASGGWKPRYRDWSPESLFVPSYGRRCCCCCCHDNSVASSQGYCQEVSIPIGMGECGCEEKKWLRDACLRPPAGGTTGGQMRRFSIASCRSARRFAATVSTCATSLEDGKPRCAWKPICCCSGRAPCAGWPPTIETKDKRMQREVQDAVISGKPGRTCKTGQEVSISSPHV